MPVIDRIRVRRGTAAEWTSANPVLVSGELGLELDTGKIKGGDGVTAWSSLPYSGSGGGGGGGPVDISDVTGLQAELDNKQDALVSGTNIKTINGTSILGSGNMTIGSSSNIDGGSSASVYTATGIDGGGA